MKNSTFRNLLLLVLLLTAFGCTQTYRIKHPHKTSLTFEVKELYPGLLEGYLSASELPNSLALLPPPPEVGSIAWQLDQEKAAYYVNLNDEERKQQAVQDADLSFPNALMAFNPLLPVKITEQTTPVTYIMIRRILADAALSTYSAKKNYMRSRPFMVNNTPTCIPEDEESLRKDGSYPSGHTAIGWAWALVIAELFPDQANEIFQRGKEFGISRNVCNVHWFSDVEAGRTMGAVTMARLHANNQFLIDLNAAKKEIQTLQK